MKIIPNLYLFPTFFDIFPDKTSFPDNERTPGHSQDILEASRKRPDNFREN